MTNLPDRFWAKVNKTETCWLWTGSIRPDGYPQVYWNGRPAKAHRVAYECLVGPIPLGLHVDHMCYVRACVNPAHLQAVSQQGNQENLPGARADSQSGIRGVCWDPVNRKWRVQAKAHGRNYSGGRYADIEDARLAAIALRNRVMSNNLADRGQSTQPLSH